MYPVRYIHAADLHLDAAFKGLSREAADPDMAKRLHQATFTALERLVDMCVAEKPDFLVIAGDIYNQEDRSIKAQLCLRDACKRLGSCGIQVFLAHGNHDPLPSRLQTLNWPDNVVIFGDGVESWPVLREGKLVAVVHGISHSSAKEGRNLAQAFSRQRPRGVEQDSPCFHLGVLHCTLESSVHGDRYAPCTLADLEHAGLDAWALGHIHQRAIVSTEPFVAYAGNTQGLHILEGGPRGCLLVHASPQADNPSRFHCKADFRTLGPVQWETLAVDMDDVQHIDALEGRLMDAVEAAAARTEVSCQAVIVRLCLTGRTVLDKDLRTSAVVQELAERLRANTLDKPAVWIKDIQVETGQELDMGALCKREDLLGEVARIALTGEQDAASAAAFAAPALDSLFKHAKAKSVLARPDDAQMREMLVEARKLCIDLMEAR